MHLHALLTASLPGVRALRLAILLLELYTSRETASHVICDSLGTKLPSSNDGLSGHQTTVPKKPEGHLSPGREEATYSGTSEDQFSAVPFVFLNLSLTLSSYF